MKNKDNSSRAFHRDCFYELLSHFFSEIIFAYILNYSSISKIFCNLDYVLLLYIALCYCSTFLCKIIVLLLVLK